jgi:hypothetical protein
MAESKLKDENYYIVQGFMINRLGLKGIALNVYAIIYGFSQDGETEYTGSLQYLCDFTGGTSKPTMIKALKELVEKGYIIRREEFINGVQFNRYKANLPLLKKLNGDSKENLTGGKETLLGGLNNLNGGGKEILPNNKDNINNNINNNINKSISNAPALPQKIEKAKPIKHKRGEYGHVLLTDEQEEKLISEYGEIVTIKAITFLDEYIEEKNYKSKNHYLTIRKWVIDAVGEREQKKGANPKPRETSFDLDEFFNLAVQRGAGNAMKKTTANDEALRQRAEELKKRLG